MPLLVDAGSIRERIEALPTQVFPEGTPILSVGTSTGKLFILASGTAEVMKDGVRLCELTEPGAVLGEISALLGQPHTADVRAVTACTFRVADATEFLRGDPTAALLVATIMAKRLDAANQALVEVRREISADKPRSVVGRALDRLAEALRQDTDPELARYMYGGWM
ncbi:MAG TPA: cyclic nucleotide-binding domain-containing protein [Geminicoccus sp.]|uniref:Crp/Fnr family transcriptional regulator n=1 Tax=Geminicoccus sp. TaxID=2024832 RepID=UPI002E3155F1|nr:cyclic nucleotide-binding domain-containing protein [Geminicoccus sp.]HEX2527413.1 cyclic nucleotide-binding domain-containing protein [Geminicoccus sp.]